MKTVRITEFEDWGECPWKWDYKWQRRLTNNESSSQASIPQIIGSAIHFGMESGLTDREAALEAARLYIQANHPQRLTDQLETKLSVVLDNMPWDVLGLLYPVTEQLLSVTYGDLEVRGKPDLYGLLPDSQILVIDFKTTASKGYQWSNKLQVESTFNLQLPFYAVLLSDYYHTDVLYQHIIVGTEKRGQAWVEEPKLIGPILEQIRKLLIEKGESVGNTTAPSEGWHCLYCPYHTIDEVRLTGGDWEYEIETNWHRRVDRQTNVVIDLEPEKGGEDES